MDVEVKVNTTVKVKSEIERQGKETETKKRKGKEKQGLEGTELLTNGSRCAGRPGKPPRRGDSCRSGGGGMHTT